MPTYRLIVDQHIRYFLDVDARNPEQAAGQVAFREWDDSDNSVVNDVVRVYTEDDEGRFVLIGATDVEQLQIGGLAFTVDDKLADVEHIEADEPDDDYDPEDDE